MTGRSASSGWSVLVLNADVAAELGRLDAELRARFDRIVGLIEALGPHQVGMPHVRPLEGKLWEMRMSGRNGIARAIYLAASGQQLVVLHVFMKKTERTPRGAIEMALKRGKAANLI